MSNEFSTPKLTPADAVKIPGVDGNNDSGYLLSEEVKDYMVGGLFGDVPEYSTLETYSVGARAMNGGDLYRCTTPVSTPEVFDPTKWTKVDLPSLDERVSDNEEDIATNATNIQANADAITSLMDGKGTYQTFAILGYWKWGSNVIGVTTNFDLTNYTVTVNKVTVGYSGQSNTDFTSGFTVTKYGNAFTIFGSFPTSEVGHLCKIEYTLS